MNFRGFFSSVCPRNSVISTTYRRFFPSVCRCFLVVVVGGGGCRMFIHKTLNIRSRPQDLHPQNLDSCVHIFRHPPPPTTTIVSILTSSTIASTAVSTASSPTPSTTTAIGFCGIEPRERGSISQDAKS
ncbi:hypothetical protein YC2023_066915 [Brassica napus]